MSLDDNNGINTDKLRNIYNLIQKFLYQALWQWRWVRELVIKLQTAVGVVRETATAHAVLCTHSPSLDSTDHENDTS